MKGWHHPGFDYTEEDDFVARYRLPLAQNQRASRAKDADMNLDRKQREQAFWQKLILPEEDRDRPWDGFGYRWFKSPNVVPLERYRHRKDRDGHRDGGNSVR